MCKFLHVFGIVLLGSGTAALWMHLLNHLTASSLQQILLWSLPLNNVHQRVPSTSKTLSPNNDERYHTTYGVNIDRSGGSGGSDSEDDAANGADGSYEGLEGRPPLKSATADFFGTIDRNEDGVLEASELRKFVEHDVGGVDLDEQVEVDAGVLSMFAHLDTDADSAITLADMRHWASRVGSLVNVNEAARWAVYGVLQPASLADARTLDNEVGEAFRTNVITGYDFPELIDNGGAVLHYDLGITRAANRRRLIKGVQIKLAGMGSEPRRPLARAVPFNENTIRVEWDIDMEGADENSAEKMENLFPTHTFVVEGKVKGGQEQWEPLYVGAERHFVDTNFELGTPNYYRIQAWNIIGHSEYTFCSAEVVVAKRSPQLLSRMFTKGSTATPAGGVEARSIPIQQQLPRDGEEEGDDGLHSHEKSEIYEDSYWRDDVSDGARRRRGRGRSDDDHSGGGNMSMRLSVRDVVGRMYQLLQFSATVLVVVCGLWEWNKVKKVRDNYFTDRDVYGLALSRSNSTAGMTGGEMSMMGAASPNDGTALGRGAYQQGGIPARNRRSSLSSFLSQAWQRPDTWTASMHTNQSAYNGNGGGGGGSGGGGGGDGRMGLGCCASPDRPTAMQQQQYQPTLYEYSPPVGPHQRQPLQRFHSQAQLQLTGNDRSLMDGDVSLDGRGFGAGGGGGPAAQARSRSRGIGIGGGTDGGERVADDATASSSQQCFSCNKRFKVKRRAHWCQACGVAFCRRCGLVSNHYKWTKCRGDCLCRMCVELSTAVLTNSVGNAGGIGMVSSSGNGGGGDAGGGNDEDDDCDGGNDVRGGGGAIGVRPADDLNCQHLVRLRNDYYIRSSTGGSSSASTANSSGTTAANCNNRGDGDNSQGDYLIHSASNSQHPLQQIASSRGALYGAPD